jgi:hypothetical protein
MSINALNATLNRISIKTKIEIVCLFLFSSSRFGNRSYQFQKEIILQIPSKMIKVYNYL